MLVLALSAIPMAVVGQAPATKNPPAAPTAGADGAVSGGGLSLKPLKDALAGDKGSVGKDKAFPVGKDPEDIYKIANGVILTFFALLALIFLVMMLYGGYNWMTAMGDDEKVTKAKDTIIASVIGVIILLSGYAITTFVITNIYGNVAS